MFIPLSVLEFRDRAEAFYGDKVGVVDGDREFTYREFAERTHRLANVLRDLGVTKGDRVSFITYNTHQLLEAYFGVIEAGAVLNPINIRLAPHEIAYIVGHAGSKVLFYHHDFRPLVEAMLPHMERRPTLVVMEGDHEGPAPHEYEALLAAGSTDYDPAPVDENDIAELFYTSGSTGQPKGVATSHRTVYLHALYAQAALHFSEASTILHVVPLFHVNAWGMPHMITMVGGRHVMLRRFAPNTMLGLIEKHRVTDILAVPVILNALVNHADKGRSDLSSWKHTYIGGAPSSPALIRAVEELGPQALAGYGMTETSPILTIAFPREGIEERETQEQRIARQAMTGWALPGIQLRVVDHEGQNVRPDGREIGEIVVRGNTVMTEYYKDPEATAATIRNGWLHTGDMATMDEHGYVLIRDRAKDIIIRGGENISSVEIENALYEHPAVLECAVVAAPHEKWGEVPAAIVVLKEGAEATVKELQAHCRRHIAPFKVPSVIEFRDQLPKTGTGKILKRELREPYWAGQEARVH